MAADQKARRDLDEDILSTSDEILADAEQLILLEVQKRGRIGTASDATTLAGEVEQVAKRIKLLAAIETALVKEADAGHDEG